MTDRNPKRSSSYLPRRRRRRSAPAWIAVTGFALVLGTLAVMARPPRPSSAPETTSVVATTQAPAADVTRPASALSTINERRSTVPSTALPVSAETPASPELAGGNAQDFDTLIELIENEVDGAWDDDGGESISDTGDMAGIHIDPSGLLTHVVQEDRSGRLAALNAAGTVATDNADVLRSSRLRLVSLKRLEQNVQRRLAAGEPLPEELKYLAGLEQVRFVFVYPHSGDIVIAGPAEGWQADSSGNARGALSGHPVLQLDDLVTVLRSFEPEGSGLIGCSIDPRAEGLQRLRDVVARSNNRGALDAGAAVRRWIDELQTALGRQDITITGVPADSRVARVLVEADYKMKLIGIGTLDAGSEVPGIFDLLTAREQRDHSLDALRWWLSMKYSQVLHSSSRDTFQLVGSAVLCQSENQFVNDRGERVPTGRSEGTNRRFAENFTRHYPVLSRRDTVFADLKNVFDLALVAALINRQGLAEQADWDLGVFATNGDYETASHPVPRTVNSVVNHRVYRGRDIVVQAAGGVRADVSSILRNLKVVKANPRLNGVASAARPADLPEGRWWWDIAVK